MVNINPVQFERAFELGGNEMTPQITFLILLTISLFIRHDNKNLSGVFFFLQEYQCIQ